MTRGASPDRMDGAIVATRTIEPVSGSHFALGAIIDPKAAIMGRNVVDGSAVVVAKPRGRGALLTNVGSVTTQRGNVAIDRVPKSGSLALYRADMLALHAEAGIDAEYASGRYPESGSPAPIDIAKRDAFLAWLASQESITLADDGSTVVVDV